MTDDMDDMKRGCCHKNDVSVTTNERNDFVDTAETYVSYEEEK